MKDNFASKHLGQLKVKCAIEKSRHRIRDAGRCSWDPNSLTLMILFHALHSTDVNLKGGQTPEQGRITDETWWHSLAVARRLSSVLSRTLAVLRGTQGYILTVDDLAYAKLDLSASAVL